MTDRCEFFLRGEKFRLDVCSGEYSYGKWVQVALINSNGVRVGSIKYGCHPEFDDFDLYQRLPLEQLEKIALDRFPNDAVTKVFENFLDSKGKLHGGVLQLRFNRP